MFQVFVCLCFRYCTNSNLICLAIFLLSSHTDSLTVFHNTKMTTVSQNVALLRKILATPGVLTESLAIIKGSVTALAVFLFRFVLVFI